MDDLVHIVVTIRCYEIQTFTSEIMHRRWAEDIFFEFPRGPFRVSKADYDSMAGVFTATVEVAGGWDFMAPLSQGDAFVVASELERIGFDVASAVIVPETDR